MTRDENVFRLTLGHPCSHDPHPHLADLQKYLIQICTKTFGHVTDQLDADPGGGVGALEVVDQLGKVLDTVNVVVGRGGDETHSWH